MTDTTAPERVWFSRDDVAGWIGHEKPGYAFGNPTEYVRADLMERRIAEAVEAERERCADYALMWVGHWEDEEGDAASVIAAAIRTQTEGQNNLTPDSKGQASVPAPGVYRKGQGST